MNRRTGQAKKADWGFARMTPEQRQAVARSGGLKAKALGRAHRWSTEEARAAGRKGGRATHAGVRAFPVVEPAPPETPTQPLEAFDRGGDPGDESDA